MLEKFISKYGKKLCSMVSVLTVLTSLISPSYTAVHAAGNTVNVQLDNSTTMNVEINGRFKDHNGDIYIQHYGPQEIIYDAYTGEKMFCVEPGPTLIKGVHSSIGSLESYFGKAKADELQLIAWYGTRSGNAIDYFAAQCLIWEVANNATIVHKDGNGQAIASAKAVIRSKMNTYLSSGKTVKGTSQVYRIGGKGQDIMSVGTVVFDKKISVSLTKSSASLDITANDASYSLANAKYRVYEGQNTQGKLLCELVTDVNGHASKSDLVVDEDLQYITFVEVQAPLGYELDSTPHTQRISSDNSVSLNVSETPETKKIRVEVNKSSGDAAVTADNPMYSLKDASFDVSYLNAHGEWVFLGRIVTDEKGYACGEYAGLPLGVKNIRVVESTAPKGYYRITEPVETVLQNGVAAFSIQDMPALAPMHLEIEKQPEDNVDNPASLAGAEFTVRYYACDPSSSIDSTSVPTRTWTIVTKEVNDRVITRLSPEYLAGGDELYTMADGSTGIPLGVVTIEETKAPEGYTLSHVVLNGSSQKIEEQDGRLKLSVVMDGESWAVLKAQSLYIYEEQRAAGGLSIRKLDSETGSSVQGNARNLSAQYRIINLNDYDVAMKINGNTVSIAKAGEAFDYTVTTDENGVWKSDADSNGRMNFLQVGTYRLEEIKAPEGYLIGSSNPSYASVKEFTIQKDRETVLLENCLGDDIQRGSFEVRKNDSDTGRAQGDADLRTVFTLYNRSEHPVVVRGKTVAVNGVVDVDGDSDAYFSTDTEGYYRCEDRLLPYGTYELVEVQAPAGYERNHDAQVTFTVNEDRQVIDLTHAISDSIVTGRFSLYKHYNHSPSSEWDDVPEEGAVFLAVLKSVYENRYGSDIHAAYEHIISGTDIGLSPLEYSIVITDEHGIGTSGDLAYGTYVIGQISGDSDTEIVPDVREFTVSGVTETVYDVNGMAVTLYSDQKPVIYSVTNDYITYRLSIVKKDADTGKTVTLNGASFMIGYDCDNDGQWTEKDRAYNSKENNGNRIVNGFVTQRVGTVEYDVFRTYSGKDESIGKGTFVVNTGNASEDDYGVAVTPLNVERGSYFVFETDHDNDTVYETPAGYITAVKENVQAYGSLFTAPDHAGYEVLDDGENSCTEKLYTITTEVPNRRVYGKLTLHKSIEETEYDTTLVSRGDLSVFGFELFAAQDIIDPADGSVITAKGNRAKAVRNGEYVDSGVLYPDTEGTLILENIPLGKYVLKETVVPDCFVHNTKAVSVEFTQDDNDRVTEVIPYETDIVNHTTRVFISKKSVTDMNELPGASLSVCDMEGNVIDAWISSERPHIIEGLHVNEKYVLKEDLAPLGYVKASSVVFTVKNTETVQKVTMVDEVVSVFKTDSAFKGLKDAVLSVEDETGAVIDTWTSDGSYHRVNGLEEGKTYVLKEVQAPSGYVRAKDIVFTVTKEGKEHVETIVNNRVTVKKTYTSGTAVSGAHLCVLNMDGEVMDEWISDEKGHDVSNLVQSETYILRETEAPEGYVRADDVVFTADDHNRDIEIAMIDTQVFVEKSDENGKAVTGALLQVLDEEGKVKDEWYSDGTAHAVSGLETGKTYVLHECESEKLVGHYLSEDMTFTVTDKDMTVVMMDASVNVVIEKKDEYGNPVEGVQLKLYDLSDKSEIALPDQGMTKKEAMQLRAVLKAGHTYRLEEVKWTEGYHPAPSVVFSIPLYGTCAPIAVTMTDLTTEIGILKQDDAGNPVAGAQMEILEKDEEGNETCVYRFTTSNEPVDVSGVLKGTKEYILRETEVPQGYEQMEDMVFTAEGTGESPQLIIAVDFRKTYRITAVKTDSSTKETLPEAKFTLKTADGSTAYDIDGSECTKVTDENGEITWTVFFDPAGYVLEEVCAPQGYTKTDRTVSIDLLEDSDEDGKIRTVIENSPIPKTSDQTGFMKTGMVFLVAMSAAAMVLLFRTKHE